MSTLERNINPVLMWSEVEPSLKESTLTGTGTPTVRTQTSVYVGFSLSDMTAETNPAECLL